ncbi:hypothetical protein [Paludisphaera mucosa]|uniref:PEP-CTERM protein-sorting domain-containing protein n=1 Tax=Paludisphaera mucosa TaxID=3030827 RepID=A0ABT6FI86_9BACT|nr:hypothetical protein [Paludisphaera mucosa]MDG3007281.1 hypothetical protein [Paludisphaera mucosa]
MALPDLASPTPVRIAALWSAALVMTLGLGGLTQAGPIELSVDVQHSGTSRPDTGATQMIVWVDLQLAPEWTLVDFSFDLAANPRGETLDFQANRRFDLDLAYLRAVPGGDVRSALGSFMLYPDSPWGTFDRAARSPTPRSAQFDVTARRSLPGGGDEYAEFSTPYSFFVAGPLVVLPEPPSLASALGATLAVGGLLIRRRARSNRFDSEKFYPGDIAL